MVRRPGRGRCRCRAPVDRFGDRVADRLHEAVDEGGLQVGARGGVDAPGGDEALLLGLEELRFPVRPLVLGFDRGERTGHALADLGDGFFIALGILLDKDFPEISCEARVEASAFTVA